VEALVWTEKCPLSCFPFLMFNGIKFYPFLPFKKKKNNNKKQKKTISGEGMD